MGSKSPGRPDRTPDALRRRAVLALAAHLRDLRAARGINQETAAVSAALSFKSYQRLESTAEGIDVKVSTVARLAALFGVEVHELFAPTAPPPRRKPGRPPTRATPVGAAREAKGPRGRR